jgi:hypothetical protein
MDFLENVLSLDELLTQQKKVYEVPRTIDQIKQDLVVRIPRIHDLLDPMVRSQFTSALVLTRVNIPLEDYAVMAFPALRGLEGFCYQLLRDVIKVSVKASDKLGNYVDTQGSRPTLLSTYRTTTPEATRDAFEKCYALWQSVRHRLFHMDGTLETTRILGTRSESVSIVNDVLNLIDASHRAIPTSQDVS